jgi:hypothetical protein
MVADTFPVVDTKATGIMPYQSSVLSPDTHPFCFFTCQNTEKLSFSFRYISLSTCDVLDLFTEIIVINS